MSSFHHLCAEDLDMQERVLRRANNRDSRASSLLEWERQYDEAHIERFLNEEENRKLEQYWFSSFKTSRESSQSCECESWDTHIDTTYGHAHPRVNCKYRTDLEKRVEEWIAAVDPTVGSQPDEFQPPRIGAPSSVLSVPSVPHSTFEIGVVIPNCHDTNFVDGVAQQIESIIEADKSAKPIQRRPKNDTDRMKKDAALKRKKLTEKWKERSKIIKHQQFRYFRKLKNGFKNRRQQQQTANEEVDLEVRLLKKMLISGNRLLSLFEKRRVKET